MPDEQPPYWFHAKRYGWGWGLPARREGWIVLITWLLVVVVVSPYLALRSMPLFFLFMFFMATALTIVCFAKGEPPRWRWGEAD